MIEASGLTKRYGSTLAVDGLSFDVRPGRVTGFLGPNGAGKSTTLRMVMGLDAPTKGTVTIGGRPYASGRRCLHPRTPRRLKPLFNPAVRKSAHARVVDSCSSRDFARVDGAAPDLGRASNPSDEPGSRTCESVTVTLSNSGFSLVPGHVRPQGLILRKRVEMGISVGLLLFAVGAILRYAVSISVDGVNLHVVGVILMIVGVVGALASAMFWSSFSPYDRRHRSPVAPERDIV